MSDARATPLPGKDPDFRALFESAPDGIFVAGPDGSYTDVNPAGCQLLGYSREELLGRTIMEFVAPSELARQAALIARLLSGEIAVTQWNLRRKDGTYVPVELSARALPGGYLLGFVRDVGERLRTEEALRLSEAMFSGIFSISADAIISVDESQRITMFNDGAAAIFGYAPAEILGAPLETLVPERLRAVHRAHVAAFAIGEAVSRRMQSRGGTIIGRRKNGEEFRADAAISKLEVGGKRLLTVSLRDVTEQTRLADEQRLLADLGHVLVDAGADQERILTGVARVVVTQLADWCAVDLMRGPTLQRLRIVHADPAKAELCAALEKIEVDRTRPNLVSRVLGAREPLLIHELSRDEIESSAQGPEHLRLLRALDPTSVIVAPLIARGQALGTITIGSSGLSRHLGEHELRVTERLASRIALAVDNARLTEALERAVRAREEVLAIVAHDLRNPINSIAIHAQLMKRLACDHPAECHEGAETIHRAAMRMNQLVHDLLDITQLEAGQSLSIQRASVPAASVVRELVEAQRQQLAASRRQLRVEAAAETLAVFADRARLQQVLENLVGNAMKFARSTIVVKAVPSGGEVVFSVADDGPGIPAADRPRLFDRFWQATKGDRRGAGLGLSIVKAIVEAHGGRVWVESEVGAGTTFYFTLPVPPSTTAAPTEATVRDVH